MGLDLVEVFLQLEEEFDFQFDDREVYFMHTLGDMHDYILATVFGVKRVGKGGVCPTRTVFYRIRDFLVRTVHFDARSLRPSTPMKEISSRANLYHLFNQMKKELNLVLPQPLNEGGKGVFAGFTLALLLSFFGMRAVTDNYWVISGVTLFSLLPGVILGYCLGVFFPPVVPGIATVGDLSRAVVQLNSDLFLEPFDLSPEKDRVWSKLCQFVADTVGVRPETLSRETRFVEDLGC